MIIVDVCSSCWSIQSNNSTTFKVKFPVVGSTKNEIEPKGTNKKVETPNKVNQEPKNQKNKEKPQNIKK